MEKSAEDILAIMRNKTIDYNQMKKNRAKESCKVLENILNSIQKQRELACHYEMAQKGLPIAGEYPSWACAIAYRLYDPENMYGDKGKAGLFNLCQKLIDEFDAQDPYFAKQLACRQDAPRYLKQAAIDFILE